MRFHLPEPLHGWREFIHEITIIVLGGLIALAAQQVVEAFQWRVKVHRAEAAMRLELAEDDGPQAYGRMLIARCLDEQIARIHDGAGHVPASQLRQWVQDYRRRSAAGTSKPGTWFSAQTRAATWARSG